MLGPSTPVAWAWSMPAIVFGVGFSVIALYLLALCLLGQRPAATLDPPIDFDPPFPSARRWSPEEAPKWASEDRLFLDDGVPPFLSDERGSAVVAYLLIAVFISVAVFRPDLVAAGAYRLANLFGLFASQLEAVF